MLRHSVVAFSVALFPLGCSQPNPAPPDTSPADREALAQLVAEENAGFAAKDVERVIATLASDVVLMPPNEPIVRGQASARTWFQTSFTAPGFKAGTAVSDNLVVVGEWAFERLVLRDSAGQAVGKVLHVYHRSAPGKWSIVEDIFNFDSPPSATK